MGSKPSYEELEQRVAELERTEAALLAGEVFLDRVIDQSPFATWISDAEGTLQRANPALKKVLNLTDEQLVGKYNVLKDPVIERQGLLPLLRTVFEEGKAISFSCEWDGKDIPSLDLKNSNSVSVEATMFPIHSPEGEMTNVVLNWIDVTDRKRGETERLRLEQDYQTLFREMLDGFALHEIICDSSGKPVDYRFIAVNPAFERMTGLKAGDIVGRTVLEVLPETESHWIETFGRVALTGKPALFENYSIEIDKHFEVKAFRPALDQFACIFVDITDRKKDEEELARLNADLSAKNTELEQVVYVASHDLRSPLVNIDGYSRELDYAIKDLHRALGASSTGTELFPAVAPLLEEEIPEALRFIRTSASRMDMLLTGLLRLSRSGRAILTIAPIDMNELVSNVVDSIEFQIKETGVELQIGDLPPCQSDSTQTNQVFLNLLGNALKYLDDNRTGVIRISGRTREGQSIYCIEDNGIGIAPAHLDKIFVIFHRLDPRHGEGEGLGLTIVKRIVGRLGGGIRVESELGAGSRFYVALPAIHMQDKKK